MSLKLPAQLLKIKNRQKKFKILKRKQ